MATPVIAVIGISCSKLTYNATINGLGASADTKVFMQHDPLLPKCTTVRPP